MRFFLLLLFCAAVYALPATNEVLAAQTEHDITVTVSDQDFQISRFPAKGDHLVIWISPGPGLPKREAEVAAELARQGVEVWYTDILDSLFLPRSANSMRSLDGHYIEGLISEAHKMTGKKVVLLTRAYASIPVLRAARLWQQHFFQHKQAEQAYFSGAILISPELHIRTVELGLKPDYAPIATATNIPIVLYQAGKRGNRWQLSQTMKNLHSGGSRVYLKLFPGVTGLFYPEDTAHETLKALSELPTDLSRAVSILDKERMPEKVLPLKKSTALTQQGGRDIRLMPFKGHPKPYALNLEDTRGKHFIKKDYRGRVTLVNFWASWCGPCIREIPSLNRLRKKMHGKPFQLISINYGDDKQQVADFMKKVAVHYPVLLDKDGEVAKQWGIYVFPATFVIGPDGRIQYGVNGGIYWDKPEVIEKLDRLMASIHH